MTSPLISVNNSPINTYGQRSLTVNFGLRRTFQWLFPIADIKQPILGADFLDFYNLAVDMHSRSLVDMTTRLSVHGVLSSVTATGLRDFVPPSLYEKILADFTAITRPCTGESPVKHTITVGRWSLQGYGGSPVATSAPRPLRAEATTTRKPEALAHVRSR